MKNLAFPSVLEWKIIILPIPITSYLFLKKVGRMYLLNKMRKYKATTSGKRVAEVYSKL